MKNKLIRTLTLIVLACCLAICGVFVACGTKVDARIDVDAEPIEVQLGEYTVPIPDVVDKDGTILSGYEVKVASIKDKDGNSITYQSGTIIVNEPTTVYIVYTAKGVDDATLTINFVKTEPPVLTFTEGGFPNYFFNGQWYDIPMYTADGADESKTVISVYWLETEDAAGEKVYDDVTLAGGFEVKHNSGFYKVVIYLEDSYGNGKEYPYIVPIGGPETTAEGATVYFEDSFGAAEQVSGKYGWLKFEYTAKDVLPEEVLANANQAMQAAAGLTHITADEALGTATDEYDISVDLPYIQSITGYTYLYFDIYNASDATVPLQLAWTEGRPLAANSWTRVVYPLELISQGKAVNAKESDITGLQIYLGSNKLGTDVDLYIGNIYMSKQATQYVVPDDQLVEDQVFYFNTPAGVDHIAYRAGNPGGYPLAYNADVTDPATGLKGVTVMTNKEPSKASGGATGDFVLNAAYIPKLTDYALLAMRVYNPNKTAAYIGYLTNDSANGVYLQYDLAPEAWTTVYFTVDHICTTSVLGGKNINMAKFVVGGIKEDEQLYFGAAYGVRAADLAAESVPTFADTTIALNETYKPETQSLSVVVSDTCALEWARGDKVPFLSLRLTSVTLDGKGVMMNNGAFTPAQSGTYTLNYTVAFTSKEVTEYDWMDPVTATVKLTVNESEPSIEFIDLPSKLLNGKTYEFPEFKAVGQLMDVKECKVVFSLDKEDWQPVELKDGLFTVAEFEGFIRFDVVFTLSKDGSEVTLSSAAVAVEGPETVKENAVVYFEDAYGASQVTNFYADSDLAYTFMTSDLPAAVTDAGYNAVTKLTSKYGATSGNYRQYMAVQTPYITDFTSYNFLYMDVYNAGSADLSIGFVCNSGGDFLYVEPGTWGRITLSIQYMKTFQALAYPNNTLVNLKDNISDVTGFMLYFNGLTEAYIGNIYVSETAQTRFMPDSIPQNKVFSFDTPAGEDQILFRAGKSIEYNIAYEAYSDTLPADPLFTEGTGWTKVTNLTIANGAAYGQLVLAAPYIESLAPYTALAFRIYNPTDHDMKVWYLSSTDKYVIPANSIQTVLLNVDHLKSQNSLKVSYASGIKFVVEGINQGESMCLGAVYGVKADSLTASAEVLNTTVTQGSALKPVVRVVGAEGAAEYLKGEYVMNMRYLLTAASFNGSDVAVDAGAHTFVPAQSGEYTLTFKAYTTVGEDGVTGVGGAIGSLSEITIKVNITVNPAA